MTLSGSGGRPTGLPKTGGREKGTPNRATLALKEQLDALGCDPLVELAKIAMNKKNAVEIRARCLSEIAPYIYPKRKPVDMASDQSVVINVNTKFDPGSAEGGDQHIPSA
jgi:hypothetical protein